MKKIMFALVVAAIWAVPGMAEVSGVSGLKEVTVLVDSDEGTGSGVIFKNKQNSFIWTAAHVISGTQQTKKVIDHKTGAAKFVTTYNDVEVVQDVHENGRKVQRIRSLAKVIRYGSSEDIALLMVYKKNYGNRSVVFADSVPKDGEGVWHVGSFHGAMGIGSVSDGVVASTGRLRSKFSSDEHDNPFVYDQISGVAHSGSSGGGVFLKSNGKCIGLVTEFLSGGKDSSYGAYCITPSRRLLAFAKRNRVEYAVNNKIKVPRLSKILAGATIDAMPFPAEKPLPKEAKSTPVEIPFPFVPRIEVLPPMSR